MKSMKTILRVGADFWSDIRYGFRDLFRHPKFSGLAVLTLALGIGLTTAVFGIVYDVLLRPLPYAQADRLVALWSYERRARNVPASGPDFLDWKVQNRVFDQVAGYSNYRDFSFTTGGRPQHIRGGVVSTEFFRLLGVTPATGRDFLADEEQQTHCRVAIISYRFWHKQFGGASVLGRSVRLDGNVFTLVGVLPRQFWFPHSDNVDVWVPLNSDPANIGAGSAINRRDSHWIKVIARLKPSVTLRQAQEDMRRIGSQLARDYPQTNSGLGIEVKSLYEEAVGNSRPLLLILQGSVGLVLLVACLNVAGLLLARFMERRRELATRLILGAHRLRIARQSLAETAVLCFCGGALGIPVADGVLRLFHVLQAKNTTIAAQGSLVVLGGGSVDLSRSLHSSIDLHVLAFVSLVIVAAAGLCSLAPLLLVFRATPIDEVKLGGRASDTRLTERMRAALVTCEVVVAMVLLINAGLLVRSLLHLNAADSGFNEQNVLTAHLQLPESKYSSGNQVVQFCDQLLSRTRGMPGVVAAGLIDFLPFAGLHNNGPFLVGGGTDSDLWKGPLAEYRVVSSGYFRTMEVPLIAGRDFDSSDSANHPKSVIVSHNLALQFLGGEREAIGKRLRITFAPDEWIEVIGVVGDVKHWNVGEDPRRFIYFPIAQWEAQNFFLVARAPNNLNILSSLLQSELAQTDLDQTMLYDIKPMVQRRTESFGPYQMNLLAVGSFAVITFILACVGLYGVIALSVAQRTREIGIRMALGALPRQVVALVMRRCWVLTLSGTTLGGVAALGTGRLLNRFLYDVGQNDPATFLIVGIAILLLATAASYFAARGAIVIDPAQVLRHN